MAIKEKSTIYSFEGNSIQDVTRQVNDCAHEFVAKGFKTFSKVEAVERGYVYGTVHVVELGSK